MSCLKIFSNMHIKKFYNTAYAFYPPILICQFQLHLNYEKLSPMHTTELGKVWTCTMIPLPPYKTMLQLQLAHLSPLKISL